MLTCSYSNDMNILLINREEHTQKHAELKRNEHLNPLWQNYSIIKLCSTYVNIKK